MSGFLCATVCDRAHADRLPPRGVGKGGTLSPPCSLYMHGCVTVRMQNGSLCIHGCVPVHMQTAYMSFMMHAGGTFAAGKASLSGVLPLINIPVLPRNSPQERLVAGFPTIRNPSPITPLEALSPPSASPPPTLS